MPCAEFSLIHPGPRIQHHKGETGSDETDIRTENVELNP